MLAVTRPYLPSLARYLNYVEGIYSRGQLTNDGPLVRELTERLQNYLGVRNLLLVCNGSAALDLAYAALGITGSVITTPFSFVASTSVPVWRGLEPIFGDIDPDSWNLDPRGVEALVRADTSAISPVHVFGNPVDHASIHELAKRRDLKVVYDAAHGFGVRKDAESILGWGDASAMSFHATKVFHTIEGGAVIFRDDEVYARARRMINFGIDAESGAIVERGTNLKMSELHAAMGLAVLEDIDSLIERRRRLIEQYRRHLEGYVTFQQITPGTLGNGAYMPVVFADGPQCERVIAALNDADIWPRRYFFPSLDWTTPYAHCGVTRHSAHIAQRVLCLPLFAELMPAQVDLVCETILRSLGTRAEVVGDAVWQADLAVK